MNLALELIILVLCNIALTNHQMEEEELLRIKRYGDEELKNCDQCGLSFHRPQRVPAIINGTKVVSSEKYPWMVALFQSGTNWTLCGGAIISRDFVLTAAHCVVVSPRENQTMKRDKKNGTGKGFVISRQEVKERTREVTVGFMTPGYTGVRPMTTAANVIVHPDFSYYGRTHDITLIQLANPINCTYHANPICLPPPNVDLPPHTPVRISGYGREDPENPAPAKELIEGVIETIDKKECLKRAFKEEELETLYCLRGYKGQTSCFGDSGGSMFSKLYGEKYVTLGVASLQTSPMCNSTALVVYTSVAYHLQWIHQTIKDYDYGHDSQDDFEDV